MNITAIHHSLSTLPPFVVAAHGRDDKGRAVTLHSAEAITGWSRPSVIRAFNSLTWDDWKLGDIVQLFQSLHITPRRWKMIERSVASGRLDLSYIPKEQRRRIYARLAKRTKELAKQRAK
jgi:hypothetical protein